jgi:DNA (cytosine-5)-methyltransferase 1
LQAELGVTSNDSIDARVKSALGESLNWLLVGGPPCQAYSLVGRSRMRGANEEEYERDPRHFLYKEYFRIIAVHRPPIFIMENVKGLLSAKVQQQKTFELILADLQNPLSAIDINSDKPLSYKLFSISMKRAENLDKTSPEDFIVRSEEYGIPQARHRIIIIGIRSDIYTKAPDILEKMDQVSIDQVISDLPKLRSGLSKEIDSAEKWRNAIKAVAEEKWLYSLPSGLKQAIIRASKRIGANLTRGQSFAPLIISPAKYHDWYVDSLLNAVCNHETRGHIHSDLYRYFFAAVFARVNHRSPTLNDFPQELLPNHENV